jgi:asparaginyl-tRNA synthetase
VAQLLQWKPAEKIDGIVVNGYVRSIRSMKTHRFVSLGDGSSLAALQALIPVDQAEGVVVGAAVRFTGSWVASPGGSQSHELHAAKVEVVGPSDPKVSSLLPVHGDHQSTAQK